MKGAIITAPKISMYVRGQMHRDDQVLWQKHTMRNAYSKERSGGGHQSNLEPDFPQFIGLSPYQGNPDLLWKKHQAWCCLEW